MIQIRCRMPVSKLRVNWSYSSIAKNFFQSTGRPLSRCSLLSSKTTALSSCLCVVTRLIPMPVLLSTRRKTIVTPATTSSSHMPSPNILRSFPATGSLHSIAAKDLTLWNINCFCPVGANFGDATVTQGAALGLGLIAPKGRDIVHRGCAALNHLPPLCRPSRDCIRNIIKRCATPPANA